MDNNLEEKDTNGEVKVKTKRGRKKNTIEKEKIENISEDIFDALKKYYNTIESIPDDTYEEYKNIESEDDLIKIRKSALNELENLESKYKCLV